MYLSDHNILVVIKDACLHYTVPTEAPRNTNATVATSHSIMLEWDRPSLAEENGLLVRYHVIVIETQIHYTDDGEEIRGMERYLNRTYNISEGRMQLVEMLHPNYNYTIRVAAATEPGIGPFSDPITERTDMDGECFRFLYCIYDIKYLSKCYRLIISYVLLACFITDCELFCSEMSLKI